MAVVVCVHCGKEHEAQTKFCPKTGKAMTAARPPTPAGGNGPAAGRATKLMYLPPEARLPGAALPRPPARTEMMNAQGPIVAPAAPRSLVTAPAQARPAPEGDLGHARTIAMPPPDGAPAADPPVSVAGTIDPGGATAAALVDATIATPILSDTVSSPILPQANASAPATDATLAMPTLPHWDDDAQADSKPAKPAKGATPGIGTTAQPILPPREASAPENRASKTASGEVSGHGPTAIQNAATTAAALMTQPAGAPAIEVAPSVLVDPGATAPSGGGEEGIPSALPAEKSNPESWVTAPRAGDSGSARARSKSQSGAPTTPASALPSGATSSAGRSLPSWAALPSAEDMRRPSAMFTAFDAPHLDFAGLVRKTGLFYWSNRLPLLIMTAVLLGPVSVLTSGIMAGLGRNGSLQMGVVALLLGFLVSLLTMGLAWPVTSAAISLAVIHRLQGGKIEPGREYGICLKRLLPLASAVLPASLIIAIGYFLLVVPGLAASLVFALVPIVVLLEGKTSIDALKRSASVMKELLVRALGVLAAFVVLSLVVRKLITTAVPGEGFVDLFVADLAMLVLAPLPMIALTLLYLEHRRDHEGLTAESLQAELDALNG